jgi:hypothetical protein
MLRGERRGGATFPAKLIAVKVRMPAARDIGEKGKDSLATP